jgi:deoxyribodipyrimidine photo-lyase
MKASAPKTAKDAFLEEMIVRRELACNFTHFTANYDSYIGIPGWAQKSLAEHRRDRRPYVYSAQQLVNAQTHDAYWNAAMREMVCTGFMHNYMRMYWGKKILEWSRTPEEGSRRPWPLTTGIFWMAATPTHSPVWRGSTGFMTGPGRSGPSAGRCAA